jgi:hypothetical protein
MYIEEKGNEAYGPGRIGRVQLSKTGQTLYYQDKIFKPLKGRGSKANYEEQESGAWYWISGCKKNGQDALYSSGKIEIDEDVREEYWTQIRFKAESAKETSYKSTAKYKK